MTTYLNCAAFSTNGNTCEGCLADPCPCGTDEVNDNTLEYIDHVGYCIVNQYNEIVEVM
jgi:hypothetical protein